MQLMLGFSQCVAVQDGRGELFLASFIMIHSFADCLTERICWATFNQTFQSFSQGLCCF